MSLFTRTAPPLPDDIQALLANHRVIAQPREVHERMVTRARAAMRRGDTAAAPAAPRRLVLHRVALAAAAGIILVAGIASAVRLVHRPTNPAAVPAERPKASRVPARTVVGPESTAPAAVPQPTGPVEPAVTESAARAPSPRLTAAPPRPRPGDELRELRLLDRARQADVRGDRESVLAVVAEHERDFPAGRLLEEREVLRVRALVSLGRDGDARRAVARFHRQFPRSVLSRKLDDMLTGTP